MKKLVLAVIAASAMVGSVPVSAASITYTGFQQIGTVAANYSITTDGTLSNNIEAAEHVTNYNIVLTDPIIAYTLTPTNSELDAGFGATENNLYVPGYFEIESLASQVSVYFGRYETDAFFDGASGGTFQSAPEPNLLSFATSSPVIAAVPEPTSWAMMIVGLGAVGFAMRRRQKVAMPVAGFG